MERNHSTCIQTDSDGVGVQSENKIKGYLQIIERGLVISKSEKCGVSWLQYRT
jgi:hypothetical protein